MTPLLQEATGNRLQPPPPDGALADPGGVWSHVCVCLTWSPVANNNSQKDYLCI